MQESQTNSGFRQKIGSLLQNLGGRGTSSRPEEPPKPDQKAFLTEDALKELGPDTPLPIRLKTIKELQEIVATKRLEQYAIQTLWVVLKDLLESSKPTEARHVVLGFLRALIEGQYEDLGILRAHFLRVIQTHSNIEDFQPCFDILCSLTDNGKDVKYIEQDIGPYLADILANATSYGRCIEYLTLLINLLKHNTSYIEEEQLTKFIHGCCELVLTNSNDLHVSELSLDALNTVICYSYIPLSSLLDVTTTLCHSINVTPLQRQSLEIMLRLLGTHVGHSAIFTICSILQNRDNWTNALLLRGAVFSVSVSLWSSQRVESLKISFSSVLPFIQEVSTCQHIIVLYEISLSLLRLVTEYGQTLHSNEWNCLYVIFENVQDHLIHMKRDISESSVMLQVFQEIFDKMASLHHDHAHQATMDVDKFFDVVNKGINLHQLSLIMKLLVHEVGRVRVGSSKWVEHLLNVMERFYHFRMVTSIRLLVLDLLQELLINHLYCYEKELLEGVVFPLLHPVADDSDEDVCCRAVQLLIVVLNESSPDWAPPILGIINSVFQKGLQMVALKKVDKDEMKLLASKAAVFGLTPLFKAKLNSCCDVSAQVFYLLVNYLQQQMEENHFVPATCVIRIKIFNCILSLRANEDGFVGYFDENKTTFSPFFVCEKQILVTDDQEQPDEEFSLPVVYLNSTKVFSAVLCCLTKEREWTVLVEMLLGLNRILADRKLTLSASPQLGELCQKLCHIADNCQRWIDKLHNVPSRPNDSLAVYLYPVLATLCTYGDYLDRAAQNSLICSLERGVVGTCSLLCVKALNVATLEMQMMMSRLLPRVLYRIGQVAATPTMAVPVLELLANIIGFPLLYNGFVDQQYLGVFGIAIPYTDPSKCTFDIALPREIIALGYNPYVVAMSHHVIVMWFIRCRIQYRPTMAKFINKSLSTLLSVHKNQARGRSVSFTSLSLAQNTSGHFNNNNEEGVDGSNSLMMDMFDICIDMMARYSFSNVSTQPIRSPAADFLVGGGPSKSWLLGNALVTITTSGMGGGVQGVCLRCKAIQRSLQSDPDVLLAGNESYQPSSAGGDGTSVESLCSCWCRGWAEVKIRRPTGNVAWLMRIQNKLDILATPQMSDDYDHSLLGLNKPISYLDEEDENGEWGILTMDGDDDDVIGNDNTTDLSHDLEGQSHDIKERSHDLEGQSHDIKEQSHDLEGQSHDIKEQSHDLEEQSHDVDTQPEDIQQKQSSCDLEKLLHDTASEMHFDDIVEPSNSKTSPESNKNEKRVQIKLEEKTSPLQRHPNSQSWSEGRSETLAVVNMSSRSNSLSSSSFEHFPPLFSYDKGHLLCRSPSLVSGLLSDPQQLQLMTSASKSNTIAPHLINDDDDIDGFDEEPLSFLPDSGNTDDKCEEEPLRESPSIETANNHITNTEDTTTIPNINLSDSSTPDITALPSVVPTTIEEDTNTPSKKYSSTPSKARKRVMFSKHDTSASSIRDDTSTAIFNNPSFIFLQLYHSGAMGTHSTDAPPLLLPPSETIDRALKVLDHIPPYNTHKIGVIYVGEEQSTEQEILSNTSGSSRYLTLIKGLGRTINLSECTSDLIYLGGLDTDGADGQLTCYWEDDITQVIFHVATLMPTVASNPNCSNKKLHIGNNFVTIVYNDSESPFQFGTIKGQFNYAEVIVQPLTCGMNCVSLAVKKGLDKLIDCSSTLISDKWLPILVRQKALLANLASLVLLSQASHDHYPSNWLGRLKQIRRIREKILSDSSSDKRNVPSNVTNNDFTLYC